MEDKALGSETFREIYDSYRLVKVKQHAERYVRTDIKKDKVLGRKLRESLKVGEKVLALAEQIEKKINDAGNLYKSTTENIFFNRDQLFIARKIVKFSDINYYWISKEGKNKIINKGFLRHELYAINDQFSEEMEPIFIYYNNLTFDQNKQFTIEFSDVLDGENSHNLTR